MSDETHIQPLITTNDVAEQLQVNRNTVVQYVADGRLRAYDLAPTGQRRRLRFRQSDIDAFLEEVSTIRHTCFRA